MRLEFSKISSPAQGRIQLLSACFLLVSAYLVLASEALLRILRVWCDGWVLSNLGTFSPRLGYLVDEKKLRREIKPFIPIFPPPAGLPHEPRGEHGPRAASCARRGLPSPKYFEINRCQTPRKPISDRSTDWFETLLAELVQIVCSIVFACLVTSRACLREIRKILPSRGHYSHFNYHQSQH